MRTTCLFVAALSASVAHANLIKNGGFESPAHGPGGFGSTIDDWTPVVAGGGTFHPTISSWGYVAPEGNQVGFMNGGTYQQTIAGLFLTEGVTYTLSVDVVRRPAPWGNDAYAIDLLAGDAVIAFDHATLKPDPGQFLTSIIEYTPMAGDPNLGKPISVRLGGPSQVNFDRACLTIPGPATLTALAIGLLAWRRTR